MKPVTAAILISLACMVQCGKDMYTSRYDSMNVDDVIGNHRLLHAYIKCMLDEGRCTAEGRELKKHITDALQTGCSRCTDAQKKAIRHVIKHLIEHEHDFWALLVEKYDPHRIYTTKYEAEMKRTMRSKEQMSESGAGHEKADMKMMGDGPGYKKADMKMMEGGSGHEKADMKMMEGGPGHEKADMKMMEGGPGHEKADMKMMEGGPGHEKADMKMMDKMSSKTGMAEKKGA
uniref:Sensory appendage protein 5 n=1 Tax=Manduca sexta TaxID=7130 RepID=Q9U4Z4_MANSE|nr:sensory appendage protein 5 [Manduca sexta]